MDGTNQEDAGDIKQEKPPSPIASPSNRPVLGSFVLAHGETSKGIHERRGRLGMTVVNCDDSIKRMVDWGSTKQANLAGPKILMSQIFETLVRTNVRKGGLEMKFDI